jgi:5-methyltetrahydrofolate--homocysteine methyltransferase
VAGQNRKRGFDGSWSINSSNSKAIEGALAVHKGTAMVNSISLEKVRYDALLPLLSGTDLKVIALCMNDKRIPEITDRRLEIAGKLINGLVRANVHIGNIYVDPLVQPVSHQQPVRGVLSRCGGAHQS